MDENGRMHTAWYLFFLALYQRSGLNTPGISLYGVSPAAVNTAGPAFFVNTQNSPATLVVYNLKNGFRLGGVDLPV